MGFWSKIYKVVAKWASDISTYSVFSIAGFEIGQKLTPEVKSGEKTVIEINPSKNNNSDSYILPICIVLCVAILIVITGACMKELYALVAKSKGEENNNDKQEKIELPARRRRSD